MTASDAPQRQPATFQRAESPDGADGVFRTRWRESATLAEPWTQPALITAQANDEQMIDHRS